MAVTQQVRKCPVCGGTATKGVYCSKECFQEKPPSMLYVEKEYGMPAQQVMIELLNRNDSIVITSELMGVNTRTLKKWLDQFRIVREQVGRGRYIWKRKRY